MDEKKVAVTIALGLSLGAAAAVLYAAPAAQAGSCSVRNWPCATCNGCRDGVLGNKCDTCNLDNSLCYTSGQVEICMY
jgi:hypothetical protein